MRVRLRSLRDDRLLSGRRRPHWSAPGGIGGSPAQGAV